MGRFLRDYHRCWSSESVYVTDEDFGLIHAIPTDFSISTTEGEVNQPLDYVRLTPWPIELLSISSSLKYVVNVTHLPKELGLYCHSNVRRSMAQRASSTKPMFIVVSHIGSNHPGGIFFFRFFMFCFCFLFICLFLFKSIFDFAQLLFIKRLLIQLKFSRKNCDWLPTLNIGLVLRP